MRSVILSSVVASAVWCGFADAQQQYWAADAKPVTIPCSQIPGAVTSVPAPFDKYMRLTCNSVAGQELFPKNAVWQQGTISIGLAALDPQDAKSRGPDGEPHFRFSYYTSFTTIHMAPAVEQKLRAALITVLNPEFLNASYLLEMDAVTSNRQNKQIYLVIPRDLPAFNGEMGGMECDTHCLPVATDPLFFTIVPVAVYGQVVPKQK